VQRRSPGCNEGGREAFSRCSKDPCRKGGCDSPEAGIDQRCVDYNYQDGDDEELRLLEARQRQQGGLQVGRDDFGETGGEADDGRNNDATL
jgi:hypothetical protein